MLIPFRKETLLQKNFLREEVRFDLMNTICAGECAVALQTEDGGAAALGNPGRNVWLWIDNERGDAYADTFIRELADQLKEARLPGAVATSEYARLFSEAYCGASGTTASLNLCLMAYACRAVKAPASVPGSIFEPGEEHAGTVADYLVEFQRDCFHTEMNSDEAFKTTLELIRAGKLFMWESYGKTVCMAGIVRRSERYARIGYVYTPPEQRNKGYASALVAAVSQQVLGEGATPVLYADIANPASNKAYNNIGYIPQGQVDEYDFQY